MFSGLKILGLGLCASALYLAAACAPDLNSLDALYDPNAAGTTSTNGGRGNTNPGGGDTSSTAGSDTSSGGSDTTTKPVCSNLRRDSNETDVDCGGTSMCGACATGLKCKAAKDCTSGFCNAKGICAEATCADGVQNQDETAVDCGGSCSGCDDGLACVANGDCSGGFCHNLVCGNHCTSGKREADETDTDCGGATCDACADKLHCTTANDCTSKVCVNNVCQVPTCSDQALNQDESDIDCGGVCAETNPCPITAKCNTAADCGSYVCTNHKCAADINVLSGDIIDDFEDGDLYLPIPDPPDATARVGSWYVFGDGGCLNTRDNFLLPTPRGKSKRVIHTGGSGCNAWGNGLGTDFNNSTGTKYPYDATGTKGITFWARAGKAVTVSVAIPNIDTDSYVVGHTCQTDPTANPPINNCDHHYNAPALVTTTWQRFTILYTASNFMLEAGDAWVAPNVKPDSFSPKVVSVQFREQKLDDSKETYDLWVDDVAFVR